MGIKGDCRLRIADLKTSSQESESRRQEKLKAEIVTPLEVTKIVRIVEVIRCSCDLNEFRGAERLNDLNDSKA